MFTSSGHYVIVVWQVPHFDFIDALAVGIQPVGLKGFRTDRGEGEDCHACIRPAKRCNHSEVSLHASMHAYVCYTYVYMRMHTLGQAV